MSGVRFGLRKLFKSWTKSFSFGYALDCLRAFKFIRLKEGEKEIFKEVDIIQSIPLFAKKNIVDFLFGYKVNEDFSDSLSQKLIHESLDNGLASAVMLTRYGYKKPVYMPYPRAWRQHLKQMALNQFFFSPFGFSLMILRKIKEAFSQLKSLWIYSLNLDENYVSFISVPLNALHVSEGERELHNFLNYTQQKFPKNDLLFVNHACKRIDKK